MTKKTGKTRRERKAAQARLQGSHTESQVLRPQPQQVPLPESDLGPESEAETEYSYLCDDVEFPADIQEISANMVKKRREEREEIDERDRSRYEKLYPRLLQDTDEPLHPNTELEPEGGPDLESLDEVKSEVPPDTIEGNGQSPISAQEPGQSSEQSHACETSRHLQTMGNPDSALSSAENREHQSDVPQSSKKGTSDQIEFSHMFLGWEQGSLDPLFSQGRAEAADRAWSLSLFQTRPPKNYKSRGIPSTKAQILEREIIVEDFYNQAENCSGDALVELIRFLSLSEKSATVELAESTKSSEKVVNVLPHPLEKYCASKSLRPSGLDNNDRSKSDMFTYTLCRMLGLLRPKTIRSMLLLVPCGVGWGYPHDRNLKAQLRKKQLLHPWFLWNMIHEARWRVAKFDKDDSPWTGLQTPEHTFKILDQYLTRFWTIDNKLGTNQIQLPHDSNDMYEIMDGHFAKRYIDLGIDLSNFMTDPKMIEYVKDHAGVEIELPETAAMGDGALLLAKFKQILLLGKKCESPYGLHIIALRGTGGSTGLPQTWVYKDYDRFSQSLYIDDQSGSGLPTEIDSKSEFLPRNQRRKAELQTDEENRARFQKQNEMPSLKPLTEISREDPRSWYIRNGLECPDMQAPLEAIQVSEDVVKYFDAQALLETTQDLGRTMERYLLDRSLVQVRKAYGLDVATKLFNKLNTSKPMPSHLSAYDATMCSIPPEDASTPPRANKPFRLLPLEDIQPGYPSLLHIHPANEDIPTRSSTPDSEASTIKLSGTTVAGTLSNSSEFSEDTLRPPLRTLVTSPTRQEIPRGRVSALAMNYESMLRGMPRRRSRSRDLEPVPPGDMFGRSRMMARWNQRRKRSFERRRERK